MRRTSKGKDHEYVGSSWLTSQENERLQDLLGSRCVSLSSSVVQLLMALPSESNCWSLQHTGVVCFIKDSLLRSFFIRIYDIKAQKLVWEQEIYNQLMYQRSKPYFHTFPGDHCQVGLNFADITEAEHFFAVVEEKINQRNNRIEKQQRKGSDKSDRGALPPLPPPNGSGVHTNPAMKKDKKDKEKKSKKKAPKLFKGDIGAPSGFTHVSHLGMEANELDPDIKKLLSFAGISEAVMNDADNSQLIYDCIERSGGMKAVKEVVNHQEYSLPPVPSGHRGSAPQGRLGPLPPLPGQCSAPAPQRGSLPPIPTQAAGPASSRSAQQVPLPLPPRGLPPQLPAPRNGPFPPPPDMNSGCLPTPPAPGERRESLTPVLERRLERGPPQISQATRPHLPKPRDNAGTVSSLPKSQMPLPPPPNFPKPPSSELVYPVQDSVDSMPPPAGLPPPPPPVSAKPCGSIPAPPLPPPPPVAHPPLNFRKDSSPTISPQQSTVGEGGRGALLSQIQSGTKLRKVTTNREPPSPEEMTKDGLVGAIMMVMQQRIKAINPSDEDEDDEEWDST
ncbi:hypothetical protein DNTS_033017 [Danionella cerebrum]|uniref:WH1 domain-containing protein n=1 Tax=Danionella cerebrum TaxID=2873325 RepID=A0A553NN29_9TELE|nr:hypothetical protein DNTS_033017 [Danionella translucida]